MKQKTYVFVRYVYARNEKEAVGLFNDLMARESKANPRPTGTPCVAGMFRVYENDKINRSVVQIRGGAAVAMYANQEHTVEAIDVDDLKEEGKTQKQIDTIVKKAVKGLEIK